MSDDIMTDGNVSVCFSYVGARNERRPGIERVFVRSLSTFEFCAVSRRQSFASSPSIIRRSRLVYVTERKMRGSIGVAGKIILLGTHYRLEHGVGH